MARQFLPLALLTTAFALLTLAACDFGYDRPGAKPDASASEGEGTEGEGQPPPSEGEGVIAEGEGETIDQLCARFCLGMSKCIGDPADVSDCSDECTVDAAGKEAGLRRAIDCVNQTDDCTVVADCLDKLEPCMEVECPPAARCPPDTRTRCWEDDCGCQRDCQCIPNETCEDVACQEPPGCPNGNWPACQYDQCGCPFACQCRDRCDEPCNSPPPGSCDYGSLICDYDECGCMTDCYCDSGEGEGEGECDYDCAAPGPCPNGASQVCDYDYCGCPMNCYCPDDCSDRPCAGPPPCPSGAYPECNYDQCGCATDCYCSDSCSGRPCGAPPFCPDGQPMQCYSYDECGCPMDCECPGEVCVTPADEQITGPEMSIRLVNNSTYATIYVNAYYPISLGKVMADDSITYFNYQWDCGLCGCQDAMNGYGCPMCEPPIPTLIEIPPGLYWTTYWSGARFEAYSIPPQCQYDQTWGPTCFFATQAGPGWYAADSYASTGYVESWYGPVSRQANGDGTYTLTGADPDASSFTASEQFRYPVEDVKVVFQP